MLNGCFCKWPFFLFSLKTVQATPQYKLLESNTDTGNPSKSLSFPSPSKSAELCFSSIISASLSKSTPPPITHIPQTHPAHPRSLIHTPGVRTDTHKMTRREKQEGQSEKEREAMYCNLSPCSQDFNLSENAVTIPSKKKKKRSKDRYLVTAVSLLRGANPLLERWESGLRQSVG